MRRRSSRQVQQQQPAIEAAIYLSSRDPSLSLLLVKRRAHVQQRARSFFDPYSEFSPFYAYPAAHLDDIVYRDVLYGRSPIYISTITLLLSRIFLNVIENKKKIDLYPTPSLTFSPLYAQL